MNKTTPAGQRPPPYNWFPIGLRLVWLASLIVLWQSGPLQCWATRAQRTAQADRTDLLASTLGDLAGAVLPVIRSPWIRWVVLAGCVLLLGELTLTAVVLVWSQLCAPRPDGTSLRIRAPRGSTPRSAAGSARAPGEDLFRALHGLFPPGSPVRLTCLLTGRPDQLSELGLHLAGGTPEQRAAAATALRKLVLGQLPDAVVDERPDALAEALRPGVWLAWCDIVLRRAPHYPLRFSHDAAHDLLGPLVAALQPPAGVTHTEVHLVLRARRDWTLTEGWRAAGLRRLLRLKAKQLYSLADEAARLEQKLDAPAFDVSIRLVVVAPAGRPALARALGQLTAVVGQYSARSGAGAQGLRVLRGGGAVRLPQDERAAQRHRAARRILARLPRLAPPPALLWPISFWKPAPILTPDELRGLWHLPTPGLAQLIQPLPCRFLPAPDFAFIPPGATDRLALGRARHADGSWGTVGPSFLGLNRGFHITGGVGAGKSRCLANVIDQIRGYGCVYIEGKTGDQDNLSFRARHLLDRTDEARLVLIDPLDVEWPIGVNPLARLNLQRIGALDQALGALDAMLARLDPKTWQQAPGMKEFLNMAALLVLHGERSPTIAHIKQALLDAGYRARLLPRCPNVEVLDFWRVTYPEQAAQMRTSRDALLRRFNALLVPETTRHMLCASSFDFAQALQERQIVMVLVPTDRLGAIAQSLAMLLFQAFIRSAFERGGTAIDRVPYPLIVDELQELLENAAPKDVERAVAQLRSLGVPTFWANQALVQLKELGELMLANVQSRAVPGTLGPDASTYARYFASSGVTEADIANQPSDHQYVSFLVDEARAPLFSMQPLPWPAPRTVEVRPKAGRPWQTALPDQKDPLDPWLARLVYRRLPNPGAAATALARADADTWAHIQARWAALASTHRRLILAHPGLVPDRLERQRWLSRLRVAMPRVLAAASYQRQRWAVAPEEPPTRVAPAPQRPAKRTGATPKEAPETWALGALTEEDLPND